MGHLNAAYRYVLASRHFVFHEVLKDDSDLGVQIVQVVFTKINSVQQNLPFSGIVEPRNQLDDGGFALAVFANQCDALVSVQGESEVNRSEEHHVGQENN